MFNFKDYFKLLRVEQWYKNIVIFIPIIFALKLLSFKFLLLTILGFIALCLVSSSSYIINDLLDINKDKHHPEKKKRPIVSGKVNFLSAIIISIFLFVASLFMAYFLSLYFLLSIMALFIFSQIYNFYVRNVAFLDVILISVNFVIRATSGTFIIESPVSSWVILCTFFISIFLVSSKRSLEVTLKHHKEYRPNFSESDERVLVFLSILSITCVFVFFSIYSVLKNAPQILLTLPVALYITVKFYHAIYLDPEKIRNPEKFIFDKKIFLSLLLWGLILLITLYIK